MVFRQTVLSRWYTKSSSALTESRDLGGLARALGFISAVTPRGPVSHTKLRHGRDAGFKSDSCLATDPGLGVGGAWPGLIHVHCAHEAAGGGP